MNRIDLSGHNAVVVGGAGGIGGGIVDRLAASGARVVVWDRKPRAFEADLCQFIVDVTDETSVLAARDRTLQELGRIDILVSAAGATGPAVPTQDYSWADWQAVVALNLGGTFLVNRAALGPMIGQGYGRIVNIASIAGKEGNINLAAYSAAKAGVIALTKVLGRENATAGVTINALAPGLVRTPILDQLSPQAIERSLDLIPMQRAGRIDEIAAMVAWMVSQECSFTTGSVFDISGGRGVY